MTTDEMVQIFLNGIAAGLRAPLPGSEPDSEHETSEAPDGKDKDHQTS